MDAEKDTLEMLLRENLDVVRENNRILKEMRRIGRIVFWAKLVIWTLVIVIPLLLIGPILDSLTKGAGASVMGLPSAELIEEALRTYRGE